MSAALESRPPGPHLIAGRYEVLSRLAQGGMGEVFHVREASSGREVALKRLLSPSERARALFQAEYHALARLRHPYIVEVPLCQEEMSPSLGARATPARC